ncbi:15146_t:CDS:1, partial [Gigaspora rosea]
MKLFNLSYKLIALCLFLIFFCTLLTLTKSDLTYFNYTETTLNDTDVPNKAPFVINLDTYSDGTTLAQITRWNLQNKNCSKYYGLGAGQAVGLENILRIRVIQLNGTVIEINLDLKLDPMNY